MAAGHNTHPRWDGISYDNIPEDLREQIALEYLSRLTPGFQKFETFKQLARLGGLDTVEILPIRESKTESGIEALLARRPADDHFWPNLLHVAGSVVREDDPIEHIHDFDPAIDRAMKEFGGSVKLARGPLRIDLIHRRGERSREVTVRFWGEVEGEPAESGEFYDSAHILRHAPEMGIFDDHAAFVEQVASAYRSLTK
jgi:hypothetical protein